ncbi:hypothetical protein OC842_003719 [Tilletia horrida]|uniref:Ubiquitin-like protease family profile domain-containing protein n=1 Tax=Tilletia horrida TaxID=155126 RepID=A0AAN6GCB6_9BASI|nr:hypothetical protein OC842_003719 [Tilletia horrida]
MTHNAAEPDAPAFSFNGTTLYNSDIQTLAEEEWVGDAIIMLLFSLLEHDAHAAGIELWSPAVVQILCTMSDDELDPATASSLFPPLRRFNILPISDAYASSSGPSPASHWSLLLLHAPPAASPHAQDHITAYHLDSLDPHNARAAARCTANFASAFERLPTQMRAVGQPGWWSTSARSGEGEGEGEGEQGGEQTLEAQENAWDCGVYVLALTQALVRSLSAPRGAKKNKNNIDSVVNAVVRSHASPRRIAHFRSAFYHWVRRWQAEARKGGGRWDSQREVVQALGPWEREG